MTDERDPEEEAPRLDDLRRRLYRSGATDDDLRRYVAQLESAAPKAPPQPEPPAVPRARRRLVVGLALGALIATGAAITVAARSGAGSGEGASASRTPAAALLNGVQRTVDGPVPVAASIDGTAAVGQRFRGYGSVVVEIATAEGSADGGRAMIDLTSTDPTRVGWRALLRIDRNDGSPYPFVLAHGAAEDRSGAHAPTTFVFATRPLTRVAIEAPSGVGWTLVVAVTDRVSPTLR